MCKQGVLLELNYLFISTSCVVARRPMGNLPNLLELYLSGAALTIYTKLTSKQVLQNKTSDDRKAKLGSRVHAHKHIQGRMTSCVVSFSSVNNNSKITAAALNEPALLHIYPPYPNFPLGKFVNKPQWP